MYCKGKSADFYFIQETHACSTDTAFWKCQWGNDIWFSFGTNRSAGVAILKGNFKGHILSHEADNTGRWIILLVDVNHVQFIVVNNYAFNNKSSNCILFRDIERKISKIMSKFPLAKVIWGGDFNVVLHDNLDRWPPKDSNSVCEIRNICLRLGVLDIWKHKNPDRIIFTWSTKDLSIQSHIDFWLISEDMADKVDTVSIEPSILTDHKGFSIKINMHGLSTKKVKGYWKMNKTLLENEVFKKEVAGIIDKYWNCACVMNTFGSYWELMKFDIRLLAISMGKEIARAKREKEYDIIKGIMDYTKKSELTNQELLELSSLQMQ